MLVWTVNTSPFVFLYPRLHFIINVFTNVHRELELIIVVLFMFSYDLEFTVSHNLVAVSTGFLLYQVAMNDNNILLFKL